MHRTNVFILICLCAAACFFSLPAAAQTQSVMINEIMSSNLVTWMDEDTGTPDWIELYNPGQSPVVLDNYGLSDDPEEPFKWTIPSATIESGGHMLVFASGKDRVVLPVQWETIVDQGDLWRYRIGNSTPAGNWNTADFDADSWDEGPSGFGYGDGDDATEVEQATSLYIRTDFEINDPAEVTHGILQIDYDDAFVAYLNGVEIARDNIVGAVGDPPSYNERASFSREAKMYQGEDPHMFPIARVDTLLVPGENILAVQVHNESSNSSDMTAIPYLTLGYANEKAGARPVPEELAFSTRRFRYHTSFNIDAFGETVVVTEPGGALADSMAVPMIPTDYSWGRVSDGDSEKGYFTGPTPEDQNTGAGTPGFACDVAFSMQGGFYTGPVTVSITADDPDAVIRYSLDGTDPTPESAEYTDPLTISDTTVLRARAFREGLLPGDTLTNTYLVSEETTLAVVSLSTTPDNLWDEHIGIYVPGANADIGNRIANYWNDWERPVHMEFFEPDGTPGFSIDAGVKILGRGSRNYDRKSLAIMLRGGYGHESVDYPVFENYPIREFTSFVLRNSGNDWDKSVMRDGFMHTLFRGIDLDTTAYRPVIVFLNGEYWGIHNLREKQNEEYLESHHGVDPDNVDMVEPYWRVMGPIVLEGDADHWNSLMNYLEYYDMSQPEHYNYVRERMEVDNFIRYNIANIYVANHDWPGNNNKAWRPRTADGRWRWLLFDLDWGFAEDNRTGYTHDSIEHATNSQERNWPNPPFSTKILRNLLDNAEFRTQFINTFADYLNTFLAYEEVTALIDSLAANIEPEMPRHFAKWSGSVSQWEREVSAMKSFGVYRNNYMRGLIRDYFSIPGDADIVVDVNVAEGGTVGVNTLDIAAFPWEGSYFEGVPVPVTAKAAPGYRFTGWSGDVTSDSLTVHVLPEETVHLTAMFEEGPSFQNAVVFNEIQYNPPDDFDTEDWVELYNTTSTDIDISGWTFRDDDDDHAFVIPEGTVLAGGDYLVLCRSLEAFQTLYPNVTRCIGDVSFGLSGGGDMVRLFDTYDGVVDSLTYDNNPPWPEEPDGGGKTLSLINPILDNSQPENWAASLSNGTPAEKNDVYVVGVEDGPAPVEFSLGQNYPNPFNPSTTIPFSLPETSHVRIEVFSILGQRVATLVDKRLDSGSHSVIFNATDHAAGLYFYRIKAGSHVTTKNMLFVK